MTKNKKNELYDDSWIYILLLTTLAILLESLKSYTFKISGVNITYSITPVEYETGLRLKNALDEGKVENDFLLMYCDNYCPINYKKLVSDYVKNDALIQFTAYKNIDNYTKNNLLIADNGLVECYDKTSKQT